MNLGELLIQSKKENLTDLEALISFLVFEKKVQKLTDKKECLERYLLPKHHKKMNRLLNDYKRKLGMKYKPIFWSIIPKNNKIRYYAVAHNEKELTDHLMLNGITPLKIEALGNEILLGKSVNGRFITWTLHINQFKRSPSIIGRGDSYV